MTISLKHALTSTVPDSTVPGIVKPSNWNAEHVLTMSANTLLGRTGADGAAEEITCTAFGRSFLDDADAAAGRTTLGLGTMALKAAADYALLAGAAFTGPVGVPSHTVANAPTAGTAGRMIYATDGDAGSPCLAVDDGTNWRRVPLGLAISAT